MVADELRREILEGQLSPGESLREVDLAERFGVARNTIREALRLLTRDGLGVHEVHRGVAVRTFTRSEVQAIFELRLLIEETSAKRAGKLTPEELKRLEEALEISEEAFALGDNRAGLNANMTFHRELVRLVGNPRMDQVFAQLLTEIRLILASMEDRSGGHWLERNRDLLRLLVDGDGRGFRRSLREYMSLARQEATQAVPETMD